MNFPKISVVTITYGHEKYIRETLDGVLMQQYAGPIEFIIANDNSPDQTDEVVKTYFQEHPAPENFEIKYTKHHINKGLSKNFVWALQQSQGKYIAFCEGDDYWTDINKLQKQVDFLERNSDFVLCFSDREVLNDKVMEITERLHDKTSFNKSEIPFTYVPPLTAVFRNVVNKIPSQLYSNFIDASLFLFLSQYGSFYYFNEKMAIYRIHEGGAYSGNSELTNYTRSTQARLSALLYLKDIDKIAVAIAVRYWLNLKKNKQFKRNSIKYFGEMVVIDNVLKSFISLNSKIRQIKDLLFK